MTTLSTIKPGDWRAFRRFANRYAISLRRIRDAKAVPADALRRFAEEALKPKRKRAARS